MKDTKQEAEMHRYQQCELLIKRNEAQTWKIMMSASFCPLATSVTSKCDRCHFVSNSKNISLTGIDVFNHDAGNASDVDFNNLTVAVPEPGVVGLASLGGALLLGYRRRK